MTAPTDTTFISGTKITSDWLNGVNDHVNNLEVDPHPSYLSKTEAASTYTTQADLASSEVGKGAELVGYLPAGAGAVATNVKAKLQEAMSVFDFMTAAQIADVQSGAATMDVTDEIQKAVNESIASGRALYVGKGGFKITDTIVIPDEITLIGAGDNKTIFKMVSSSVKPAFLLSCADNSSIINLMMFNFGIVCNGGPSVCDGIQITTTATNSAFNQLRLENLRILNPRRGVSGSGVIYKSVFNLITIGGTDGGSVAEHGFYFDAGFIDIVYNTFSNLEVTGVGNAAYAYYIHSNFSTFESLSCDGPWYISSPGGKINNLAIEGITATGDYPSPFAGQINQIGSAENLIFNNVPTTKYATGLSVAGGVVDIGPMRFLGASQPNSALYLESGGKGTIKDIQATGMVIKLEDIHSDSLLNNYVISGCSDVTNRGLSYEQGTWTPEFSTWSTPPSVSAARYVRVGNKVTIFINANGGACADYSTITGLPFTSSYFVGGTAQMSSGDLAKRFSATIPTSSTSVVSIPAQSLTTGPVYWTLTATYFVG